ncbi:hypothetical protein L3Y34_009578 [Caenorhabditis briggsae]|uniref:Uncharacterized protein n=1 Tax=Caenorhabditis briggsae TaxID=6238 RepID=A0AAE9A4I2_CAEBR|nr:hypothetical protein L3Y34_009578 [Caenorhabditis briggsae]
MNFISEELELVPPGKRDFEEERFKKQAEQNFPYQNDPILQLVYVTFSTDTEKEIVEMELSEHECYFQVLKKADEMFPLVWTEMAIQKIWIPNFQIRQMSGILYNNQKCVNSIIRLTQD